MLRVHRGVWRPWGRNHVMVWFSCQRLKSTRFYSRDSDAENLNVVCGSSGSITVDIYNTQALTNPTNPLIIYLPPTGTHSNTHHPPIPFYLFHPNTTLARINYRWNNTTNTSSTPKPSSTPTYLSSHPSFKGHTFPTPLHDVLHAYDHLISTFLPKYYAPPQSPPTPSTQRSYAPTPAFSRRNIIQRPIMIYGSFLGGTLATSLALTESRTSRTNPVRIKGLLVKDGVFNFSILTTAAFSSTPISSDSDAESHPGTEETEIEALKSTWTSTSLNALKTTLFSSPESTFDTFASPMLFFRTSGLHIPKVWPGHPSPATSSLSSSKGSNQNEAHLWADGFEGYDSEGEPIYSSSPPASSPSLSSFSSSTTSQDGIKNAMTPGKTITEIELDPPPRKSNLKYPPPNTDLIIPPTLLLYTSPSPSKTSPSQTSPKTKPFNPPKKKSPTKTTLKSLKQELGLDGLNPASQAVEMRALMVRSVIHYELKDTDEGDKRGVGEERVCVREIKTVEEDGGGDDGNDGNGNGEGGIIKEEEELFREYFEGGGYDESEEGIVREWYEGLL